MQAYITMEKKEQEQQRLIPINILLLDIYIFILGNQQDQYESYNCPNKLIVSNHLAIV